MNFFNQAVILLTILVAIYLVIHFYRKKAQGIQNIYYMTAFLVLFLLGLFLILFGYSILDKPLVVIVSTLIPAFLATGLVNQFNSQEGHIYPYLVIAGVLFISITYFSGQMDLAKAMVVLFHSIFVLTIFFLPIIAYYQGVVQGSFCWITVGGIMFSIVGFSLNFNKTGNSVLSREIIITFLAPILLIAALSYAWGFRKGMP